MSFPPNPDVGQSVTIGTKTWYWDGAAWSLLPVDGSGGGNNNQPDHTHDTPKILDDLLDVEVKEPDYSDSYGYYINTALNDSEDPNAENGWGRYVVDLTAKTITYNRYDLDGKDARDLFLFNTDVTTHRFHAVDESFNLEAKVVSKTLQTNSIIFGYDNLETLTTIHNEGKSKLFQVLGADYKALSDGAILVYRRNNELWGPEPNPILEQGNRVTISYVPPDLPNEGDIWVDENNFYMYLWDGTMWIALTGPESGNGGGDIANNSQITLLSTRGLVFDDEDSVTGVQSTFNLNQPFPQTINIKQQNITTLLGAQPAAPRVGDIWIDQNSFYSYVWDGSFWIGLTGDDSFFPATNNRLEQPCRLIGGKPNSLYCDDGGASYIPSPVYINGSPPNRPSIGDLWFDSEHLELRVWYASGGGAPGWVSSTHPGMRPDLAKAPNPPAISLTGPPVAQEETESNRYVATVGWDILENIEDNGGKHPRIAWQSDDLGASFIYKNEERTIATIKFSDTGIYYVKASVTYNTDYFDPSTSVTEHATVETSVSKRPPGLPIRYIIRVVDGGAKGMVYEIDGQIQPHLNLMRNRKYIFDQSHPSNEGYIMRFFNASNYDADGLIDLDENGQLRDGAIGDEYSKGVAQVRKDVEFNVPTDAPIRLRYGNPDLPEMGWWIYPFDADGSMTLVDPLNPGP